MQSRTKDWIIVVMIVLCGIAGFVGSLLGAMYVSKGFQRIINPPNHSEIQK